MNDKNAPLLSQDFLPLVRHDTALTLPYNDSFNDEIIDDNKIDIEENCHNKCDSVNVGDSSRNEGILFFPNSNNDAYFLKAMPKSNLPSYLEKVFGGTQSKSHRKESLGKVISHKESCSLIQKRFLSTMEVIIAKLFLAGFFWQTAASLSGSHSNSFSYAITTGVGEATGVILGNCFYDIFKKTLVDENINIVASFQTSIFLATATLCSGTTWQPMVNTLQSIGLSFLGVFVGTWVACAYTFNFGLRVGRTLYFTKLVHVQKSTWENSRTDFALSIAIGGASAFFVGTDTSYSPDENFLYHLVGIQDSMSPLVSAIKAGCSTALGFGVAQTIFNLVYPAGECWID